MNSHTSLLHNVGALRKPVWLILVLSLAACGGSSGSPSAPSQPGPPPPPPPPPSTTEAPAAPVNHVAFSEISIAAGVDFVHGFKGRSSSEESVAGVAVGDYDGDGWLDLYLTQGDTGNNYLYRNLSQGGDYEFVNDASSAGVTMALDDRSCGPAFVDYDGDGDDDLFVGGVLYSPPRLYSNNGDGTFTDVTVASGLSTLIRENNVSQAFGDYDQDGDLDLFIGHWTFSVGELPTGDTQHLWRNNGDGTFSDVSAGSLVGSAVIEAQGDFTFTPNFADIDNDGDLDLLVVADNGTSQVLVNNGDQGGGLYTFSNITDESVITDEAGMGAAVADFDHDGDLDWFVSSISEEGSDFRTGNRYYENIGNGIFADSTTSAGVRTGFWGWASCAADFNNDGHLDIFHVNGIGQGASNIYLDDPSRLFIANGDGSFTEYSEPLGLVDNKQGRGVVCFDGDQDGDIDIFVANNGDTPSLFRNDGGNSLDYLNIKLEGIAPNTAAIGARVYVASEGVTQMREISSGSNYVSQNPTEQHFGLNNTETVDSIRVIWPDRTETERNAIASNQRIRVTYPDTWSTD
ncbi:MAG: CRTAC1 family protein [Woeseiaceae bacterium]